MFTASLNSPAAALADAVDCGASSQDIKLVGLAMLDGRLLAPRLYFDR